MFTLGHNHCVGLTNFLMYLLGVMRPDESKSSSTLGRGYLFFIVIAFSARKSQHSLMGPSF